MRFRARCTNTRIQQYNPSSYTCFPQYASTFFWGPLDVFWGPLIVNSCLAQGPKEQTNETQLQNNPNYSTCAKTLSWYENHLQIIPVASAVRQKKKKNKAYLMYLVQVEILLHFRWIRCWARGPQIFQKYGYRRDVKREVPCWGDTNVRRHRQFSLPGNLVPGICVPLVSDMHMVTKHTCDRNAWLMSSISDLLPSRKANTTPTLDSQQIVSSNQH